MKAEPQVEVHNVIYVDLCFQPQEGFKRRPILAQVELSFSIFSLAIHQIDVDISSVAHLQEWLEVVPGGGGPTSEEDFVYVIRVVIV